MEFHRSTSASRQSRLSSHLNATDVSRGAITSDGRLLTRTGLYRAAHRQHRQPPPQSHNPANPTSTPRSPSPPSLSLSLNHSLHSYVNSPLYIDSLALCRLVRRNASVCIYTLPLRLASVFIPARTNVDADASVTKPRKAHSVEKGGAKEGERKERRRRKRRRKIKDRERGKVKGGGKANRRGLNSGCSVRVRWETSLRQSGRVAIRLTEIVPTLLSINQPLLDVWNCGIGMQPRKNVNSQWILLDIETIEAVNVTN